MKIAIPVEDKHYEGNVCPSFARAPFFMVYDTETKEAEFHENSASTSPGGAGVKAAQIVIDYKVTTVLTPRMGKNSADVLVPAGIQLFKTEGTGIKNNIEAFEAGKLKTLGEIHEGFHHHGGN
ncbi:NifB/NifX family molybdenum-iron cluster-binding protein [Fusibacter tunisiensis]|uniref:Fe-Mo cluster-binding NifX family protein n=1 Tax=Fusibacter tunisiensis TaxID=1008308 RepID=A0ABS2MRW8_9FIRM|nr:NifB/NifX family molybdenum-iron cluster-binding protein [Fusibacter tunisiensis]MBM7562120.1 putative Fe-Mo cluster-binding NifX family protein [Fusibacter tunisiensis]